VVLVPLGLGADPKKPDPKDDDKQVVDSKPEKLSPAKAVDFRKELGLPFASLGTLGGRIDAARRAPDPVSLANAAGELAVAEKVAGKKASLTSTALGQEAAELAKLRKQATELKAVLQINQQIAGEDALIADLKEQITSADRYAKQETEAVQKNEEPTGPRRVLINNYSTQYADIWVNGNMKTQVGPGQSQWFTIEHKWDPTVLHAYGNEDFNGWGKRIIWGNFKTYTWNLH
jgi:hypothetical protein